MNIFRSDLKKRLQKERYRRTRVEQELNAIEERYRTRLQESEDRIASILRKLAYQGPRTTISSVVTFEDGTTAPMRLVNKEVHFWGKRAVFQWDADRSVSVKTYVISDQLGNLSVRQESIATHLISGDSLSFTFDGDFRWSIENDPL